MSGPSPSVVERSELITQEPDGEDSSSGVPLEKYNWLCTSYLSALNFGTIYGLWLLFTGQFKPATLIFTFFIGLIAGISTTVGAHRLWSHRCYKATTGLRIFLALIHGTTGQGSIWHWAAWHRAHHKYSDTAKDPHDPSRGLFYAHIGWLMMYHPRRFREQIKSIPLDDLETDPVVMWQDRNYSALLLVLGVILPVSIPYFIFGESFVSAWFLAVCGRMALIQHAAFLINSVAHHYGYKPYDKNIEPTDNWLVSVFSLGEGSHNYHHAFPWDYRTSEYGGSFTFSLTTQVINCLAKLGLAYDLKLATPELVAARVKRTGTDIFDKATPQTLFL